jgi:tRNA(Ile2) C34 agmatinyltransferase TiaS
MDLCIDCGTELGAGDGEYRCTNCMREAARENKENSFDVER